MDNPNSAKDILKLGAKAAAYPCGCMLVSILAIVFLLFYASGRLSNGRLVYEAELRLENNIVNVEIDLFPSYGTVGLYVCPQSKRFRHDNAYASVTLSGPDGQSILDSTQPLTVMRMNRAGTIPVRQFYFTPAEAGKYSLNFEVFGFQDDTVMKFEIRRNTHRYLPNIAVLAFALLLGVPSYLINTRSSKFAPHLKLKQRTGHYQKYKAAMAPVYFLIMFVAFLLLYAFSTVHYGLVIPAMIVGFLFIYFSFGTVEIRGDFVKYRSLLLSDATIPLKDISRIKFQRNAMWKISSVSIYTEQAKKPVKISFRFYKAEKSREFVRLICEYLLKKRNEKAVKPKIGRPPKLKP